MYLLVIFWHRHKMGNSVNYTVQILAGNLIKMSDKKVSPPRNAEQYKKNVFRQKCVTSKVQHSDGLNFNKRRYSLRTHAAHTRGWGEIKDEPGHCENHLLSPIYHYKEYDTKRALLGC